MKMKFLFLMIAAILLCPFIEATAANTKQKKTTLKSKMFMCRKCFVLQVEDKIPAATKCNFKGKHEWFILGETGTKIFHCNKCDIMLPVKRMPNVNYCPRKGQHKWVEVAEHGNLNFQCNKCQFNLSAKEMPKKVKCKKGGTHNWVQK